jgi:hypothetical protein
MAFGKDRRTYRFKACGPPLDGSAPLRPKWTTLQAIGNRAASMKRVIAIRTVCRDAVATIADGVGWESTNRENVSWHRNWHRN